MTKHTGMTRRRKTALMDGARSAHGFQPSDFMDAALMDEIYEGDSSKPLSDKP
jgi:hypothetical protein